MIGILSTIAELVSMESESEDLSDIDTAIYALQK